MTTGVGVAGLNGGGVGAMLIEGRSGAVVKWINFKSVAELSELVMALVESTV